VSEIDEKQQRIELYPLPDGWIWETVNSVGGGKKNAIVDGPFGSNLKVSDYVESGPVPVLTTKNLEGDYSKVRYITADKFEELKRSAVNPNDILMAKIGSCGKLGIYPTNATQAMIPANLLKVTVADGYDLKYVYYFFSSPFFKRSLNTIIKSTAQPAFGVTDFKRLPFPRAPLSVQKSIVAEIEKQFSRLDEAVASLKRIQANLKRYKAAVLKAAVEGKLTEQWRKEHPAAEPADQLLKRILAERRAKWEAEELAKMKVKGSVGAKHASPDSWEKKYKEPAGPDKANLPELPEGWVWTILENVAEVVDPHPSHRTPVSVINGVSYIGMGDITSEGKINFQKARKIAHEVLIEHKERYSLKPGDFIFGKIGTIGKPVRLCGPYEYALSANVILMQPNPNSTDPDYCFTFMASPLMETVIKKESKATTQAAFGIQKVRLIAYPLPPLREQEEIRNEVGRRLSVTEELETSIETNLKRAERLRQTILMSAFSGNLPT